MTLPKPEEHYYPTPEKKQPTVADVLKHQDELKAQFGTNNNVAYSNVSFTQLSIARHFGGLEVQGKYYLYNPDDDSLIREDVVKWIVKKRKAAKRKQSDD
jgi:hypothetical protein